MSLSQNVNTPHPPPTVCPNPKLLLRLNSNMEMRDCDAEILEHGISPTAPPRSRIYPSGTRLATQQQTNSSSNDTELHFPPSSSATNSRRNSRAVVEFASNGSSASVSIASLLKGNEDNETDILEDDFHNHNHNQNYPVPLHIPPRASQTPPPPSILRGDNTTTSRLSNPLLSDNNSPVKLTGQSLAGDYISLDGMEEDREGDSSENYFAVDFSPSPTPSNTNTVIKTEPQPLTPAATKTETNAYNDDGDSHISRSYDIRSLAEAAQFAEAVGEEPPQRVKDICRHIVDEEDEDVDESDDDSNNSGANANADANADANSKASAAIPIFPTVIITSGNKQQQEMSPLGMPTSQTPSRQMSPLKMENFGETAGVASADALPQSPKNDASFENSLSYFYDMNMNLNKDVDNVSNLDEREREDEGLDFYFDEDEDFGERSEENYHDAINVHHNGNAIDQSAHNWGDDDNSVIGVKERRSSRSSTLEAVTEEENAALNNINFRPHPSPLIKCTAPPAYEYKGLQSNPPEIVKRGMSRGNTSQLHRKAWLEVSDKYHRYGKNLRNYYKFWEREGHPFGMFFDWLDSKNLAAGQPLPNLVECGRGKLDSDTVLYVNNVEAQGRYAITISNVSNSSNGPNQAKAAYSNAAMLASSPPVSSHFQRPPLQVGNRKFADEEGRFGDGSKGDNSAIFLDVRGRVVNTGLDGWIFVLRDGTMYAAPKVTSCVGNIKHRFHHSSFFGGKAVEAAGIIITNEEGRLLRLYPHSGHYRPGEAHLQRTLLFLQRKGLQLRRFDVDLQQIFHVARKDTPKGGKYVDIVVGIILKEKSVDKASEKAEKKAKKVDSLHLKPAAYVAAYLAHKALMIGEGVFAQIHKVRSTGAVSVSDALDMVDEGGHWLAGRVRFLSGGGRGGEDFSRAIEEEEDFTDANVYDDDDED